MSAPVFASTKGFDPNSTFLLLGFHYKAQFNCIIENRRFFDFKVIKSLGYKERVPFPDSQKDKSGTLTGFGLYWVQKV